MNNQTDSRHGNTIKPCVHIVLVLGIHATNIQQVWYVGSLISTLCKHNKEIEQV